MRSPKIHCDASRLEQLLHGTLSERDETQLVRHLDTCLDCQKTMEALAAESQLWKDARRLEDPLETVPRLDPGGSGIGAATDVEPALEFLDPCDRPGILGLLGNYEVRSVLGRGGMGVVLQALDPTLNRLVAIKVLAPELATSANARRRFEREARAAAGIANDHIVPIYNVESTARLPYLVMQFIPGKSLQERIDQGGPLDAKAILRIAMQTATGLASAHAQGLVHRDIKPANILLENGVERVKITDFGLARAIDDASLTQSGIVAGTPQYMSPEQARGETIDHRADLFSLGSVMYAMATGRSPFRAETTMAVLRRVSDDEPRPIVEINPEIPGWLAAIVAKLHAKDPEWRFQSAADLAELLGRCLAYLENPAGKTPPFAKPQRPSTKRAIRRLAIAATVLSAVVIGLGAAEATGVAKVSDFVATVLRIRTAEGTLVVVVNEPQVKVSIDGQNLVITGAGLQEIRLRPGLHEVRTSQSGGPDLSQVISIDRGEKRLVQVGLEPGAENSEQALKRLGEVRFRENQQSRHQALLNSVEDQLKQAEAADKNGQRAIALLHAARNELRGHLDAIRPASTSAPDPAARRPGTPSTPTTDWPATNAVTLSQPVDGQTSMVREYGSNRILAAAPPTQTVTPANAAETHPTGDVISLMLSQNVRGSVEVDKKPSPRDSEGAHSLRATLRGPEGRRIWSLVFSPDGKTLATAAGVAVAKPSAFADDRGELTLWDSQTAQLRLALGEARVVRSAAFSPDGNVLATVGFESAISLRDSATGQVLRKLEGPEVGVNAVAFSPDGKTLITGGLDTTIRIWDLATGREQATLTADSDSIFSFALAPDGRTVVAGSADSMARIWDLSKGTSRDTLRGHQLVVEHVCISHDGKLVATASWDKTVKLWSLADGKAIATLEGHRMPVLGAAFSPDGNTLVSCGGSWGGDEDEVQAGEVKIWDLTTRTIRCSLDGHADKVFDVAFSPDGKTLATGSWDASVKLWNMDVVNRATSALPPSVGSRLKPASGGGSVGTLPVPASVEQPGRDVVPPRPAFHDERDPQETRRQGPSGDSTPIPAQR